MQTDPDWVCPEDSGLAGLTVLRPRPPLLCSTRSSLHDQTTKSCELRRCCDPYWTSGNQRRSPWSDSIPMSNSSSSMQQWSSPLVWASISIQHWTFHTTGIIITWVWRLRSIHNLTEVAQNSSPYSPKHSICLNTKNHKYTRAVHRKLNKIHFYRLHFS